jgi:hypothetical protein
MEITIVMSKSGDPAVCKNYYHTYTHRMEN